MALFLLAVCARPGAAAGSDFSDSWDYYQTRLAQGASADQLEQILTRIVGNPDFTGQDMTAVNAELQRVRTEVAFQESEEYYVSRVQAGIPKVEQAALLERIIAKYEARGMDMTELKGRLAEVNAQLAAEQAPAPAPAPAPPPPPPPPPEPERGPYEWNVTFLGGLHMFPNGSYFLNNALLEPKDFNSLSGFVDVRQRFDDFSWGLEVGGYGNTARKRVFSGGVATVYDVHLEATVIRLTPLIHVGNRDNLFDLALGVGGGAYLWEKREEAAVDTVPETVTSTASNGTLFAGHATVRLLVQFTESHAFVIDYSYALAKEDDPQKINAAGDTINFGGHVAAAGVALRF